MTARLAPIALAAIAIPAWPGWAADPSDAHCSVDAARKYRVKPALAMRLPVTVKCDGPPPSSSP
jgi:hypothetical protein